MKKTYFTCGPSQLYPTVARHITAAVQEGILSLSHRSKKFQDIFKSTQRSLRRLLSIPRSHHIFFLSSSLESMERILENCVESRSFHIVDGSFSRKWQEEARAENKKTGEYLSGWGDSLNLDQLKIGSSIELICLTQNETSTGVAIPIAAIDQLHGKYPDILLAVDIVSSAPFINLNFKNVDLAFFSVQKGFGLPAGLSVLIAGKRAIDKSGYLLKKGVIKKSFHSFPSLLQKEKVFQTPETPNVLDIYLLDKVCQDMLRTGIKKIRKATLDKAKVIYDFFDKHSGYQPEVENKLFRSMTTINISVGNSKNKLMKKLESKGIVVSSGYGKFKDSHIRIANFPAHSLTDVNKLIDLISYN